MKQLLAIETSSEACSVALHWDGETRLRHQHAPLHHAELLLPAVRSLLDETGIGLASLDAIAFGRGPGSFTSLRIGIGVVQGLAWGADIPVVPVSSLATVAQYLIDLDPVVVLDPSWQILVAVDARMSEVFHCTYGIDQTGMLQALTPERVEAPGEVTVAQVDRTYGVGNGFERYSVLSDLGRKLGGVRADILPSAAALIPLALQWLEQNTALPAAAAQPVYVRNHVADKPATT